MASDNGDVLICGCNKHGELGLPSDVESRSQFAPVESWMYGEQMPQRSWKVKDVECGWWHTVALYEEREPVQPSQ